MSVARALMRALHGVGSSGEWGREGSLGSAATGASCRATWVYGSTDVWTEAKWSWAAATPVSGFRHDIPHPTGNENLHEFVQPLRVPSPAAPAPAVGRPGQP